MICQGVNQLNQAAFLMWPTSFQYVPMNHQFFGYFKELKNINDE